MSDLPPGFQLDTPPSGFRLDNPPSRPKRERVNLDPYSGPDITDRGSVFTATGEAVDGDTIRLNNNLLGRLFGVDAFEKGQMGYRPGQPPVNLGQMGTETLSSYIRPSQPAFGTGKESYNRPVVTLGNGWADPVRKSLLSGTALAAPDFMGADPARRARYLEDERLARLNRQGAHQTEYMSPDIYRSAKRWNQKLRPDEEMVWSSDVPELKPDLKRLTNEQEADYFSWLSTQYGKPDFGQADLDAYWKQRGFKGSAPADEKFFDAIRKGQRIGTIDYSGWDAQALRDFKLANGFAGLRPEVQQAYNAVLSDPKADANALQQFADVNGLTFDPRDVDAFFKARARGENPNVPIPIIDPGDGAWGAAGRGLADPFGFIDEAGGAIDAVAPAWLQGAIGGPTNRETIWNSDRGFGDIYENNTRQNRAIIDFDETRHPFARAGGQLASGLLLPYGGGVRSASGLAKLGAAEGAIYGFGSGDGTLGQRLANVPLNAAAGGVLGGALGKGGELLSPLLGRAGRLLGRGESAPAVPRAIDRIDIAPSDGGGIGLPALGERVASAYPGPVTGKAPTLGDIMPKIQDWANSQAKGTMFHGSPRAGITEFDPYGRADYGLFGQGTYLTDNPSVAAGYTAKGMKAAGGPEGRTIYGVQQNVRNPLDMDAPADLTLWEKAAGQYTDQFRPGMTNAEAFREVEDAIRQEGLPKWEGAEMMNDVVRGMGHDGVTHIGGGRYGRGDGPSHRVVIALDPEQTQITNSLSLGELLRAPQRERSWIDVQAQDAPPSGFVLDAPQGRANMDAEAMPALSSPRLRDVLDVNANRPTRLLDGPTDAMMRAATARVEPGDVLPRPANEATAEDMAALGRGPYQDVPPPRERDYLEARQYPSARNPDVMVNRRGPADLVTFARAQGGLRDEGGELAASGITNAPRKGEDFTGGENRLGRLVDQERGLSVEDMAQRAYNEGYFPELDRPPTNQEFLAALDDTYRGVGRRFRPEDEGQIQAFEGARDQRLAVERARQEGAPLAQDVGQPATLDDVIANTPPATAYDDWANAVVSKVGNVRVDKLETPQDIGQALKIADNVAGGFDAARRGKISFAETQALAQDLGMTADDLLARRKGQAFSAEEAYSARVILAKSGNELVNMAKRIRSLGDDPGSEALAMFRKALVRHTAIQEAVSGMTAEAGRALSAFRMAADSRDLPGRVLEGLASAGGGAGRLKDAADRILDLAQDPANLNRFVEKVSKPTFADRAQEIWYNYLLSGPQTHMVNILSNTMTALGQLPEHAVAAGVGAARKAFKRDEADRVLFTELGARAVGLLQGTKEGLREFGRAFRTGEAADFVTKMESQTQKAVPGIKGEILRVPTRLLTAEDELFKAMARRMELAGLAVRQAGKEGLKGQAAKERAAELLADPTDAMMEKALDYGRYVTFQRPLGDGPAGGLSRITQNHPYLKAVLPFVRTPTNLIKFTAERSPLAPMVKEWRKDFAAGGARRDLALAKVMVGSGIGTMIAELARDGVITGSEPSDQNKRRLLLANGWQPYSIKIGDTYYSYKRLDPFAMTFGTAADIATMGDDVPNDEMDQNAFLWVASVMSNFASRTWLSGITDALDALKDPERYSGNFIKRLVGSATVPTGAAQLARVIDPTMREAPDIGSYMQSRMPGKSDELLPKRDVWGQPIVSEGGVGPDIISPIWTSTDRKDPVTQEALRVGATVSPPKIGDMTPQQFDRLQPIVGNLARKWIGELMASPDYRAMDRETQAEEISKALAAARKAAKAHVVGGEPLNAERPERKRKGGRSSPPAGFQVDPLPTGFVLDQ